MARIKMDGFSCDKCSHEWINRADRDPRICPKCKSVKWNDGVKDGNKHRSKKTDSRLDSDPSSQ